MDSPFGKGLNGLPVQITASMGMSEMQEGDHGAVEAITRADVALGLAKANSETRDQASQTAQDFEADTVAA